eukprot:17845-Heterococcus_DN1.PRE.10
MLSRTVIVLICAYTVTKQSIAFTTDPVSEFSRNLQVQAAVDALTADYRSIYAAAVEHAQATLGIDADLDEQHIMIQRTFVTPLRVCVLPPEIETLNRVLRHFRPYAHRFIRVVFSDEDFTAVPGIERQAGVPKGVIERVRAVVHNGIRLGNRLFKYLDSSSSQLRENGCWFYADPQDDICATDDVERSSNDILQIDAPTGGYIRAWMGTFDQIKVVAKRVARIGQSFGTSTGTVSVEQWVDITDITTPDGRYTFSDGVGRMSPRPARQIADSITGTHLIPLQHDCTFTSPFGACIIVAPCTPRPVMGLQAPKCDESTVLCVCAHMLLLVLLQFRYAGAKGMLTLCNDTPAGQDLMTRLLGKT